MKYSAIIAYRTGSVAMRITLLNRLRDLADRCPTLNRILSTRLCNNRELAPPGTHAQSRRLFHSVLDDAALAMQHGDPEAST